MVNLKNKKYKITINLIVNLLNSFFFSFSPLFLNHVALGGGQVLFILIYFCLSTPVNLSSILEFMRGVHVFELISLHVKVRI